MRYLVLAVLVSLAAVPALATPPAVGNYSPDDGRFSESWVGAGGPVGNTLNAKSWDGASLGLQWVSQCHALMSQPTEIENTVVDGTGYIKFRAVYGGGTMWLSKDGPWGDGSEDYIAEVGDAGVVVTSTHLYVGGTRTGIVADITIQGQLRDYSNCFTYTLSNGVSEGAGAAPPPGYPEFIDENCQAGTLNQGSWGVIDDMTLSIYAPNDPRCTIPVAEASWGQIKSMYKE